MVHPCLDCSTHKRKVNKKISKRCKKCQKREDYADWIEQCYGHLRPAINPSGGDYSVCRDITMPSLET